MATFIRPARVDITEDGSSGVLAALALAVVVLAATTVIMFVIGHLAVILAGSAADAAVTAIVVRALLARFTVLCCARPAQPRTLTAVVTAAAVSAAQRPAVEAPAQHLHIHLHSVSADEVAAIIAAQHGLPGHTADS